MGSTTHSTRASGMSAALFAEKTILRKRALNALFDKGLHPLIGHADHILQVVALMVDGQRLALLIVFKRQLSPRFRQLARPDGSGPVALLIPEIA